MIQFVSNTCLTDAKVAFNVSKTKYYTHAINIQEFVNNLYF